MDGGLRRPSNRSVRKPSRSPRSAQNVKEERIESQEAATDSRLMSEADIDGTATSGKQSMRRENTLSSREEHHQCSEQMPSGGRKHLESENGMNSHAEGQQGHYDQRGPRDRGDQEGKIIKSEPDKDAGDGASKKKNEYRGGGRRKTGVTANATVYVPIRTALLRTGVPLQSVQTPRFESKGMNIRCQRPLSVCVCCVCALSSNAFRLHTRSNDSAFKTPPNNFRCQQ